MLENDIISSGILNNGLLAGLFEEHASLTACLDIGRLHFQELCDSSFDACECARALAPYTSHIHLWNSTKEQNQAGGHLPVLPSQTREDGYADIAAFIDIIVSGSNMKDKIKILFEHRSDRLSPDELEPV